MRLTSKNDADCDKTLGMLWNPSTDEFTFKLSLERIERDVAAGRKVPTKRQVASAVMSIFDPLVFLAIVKLKGLLVIQKTWRSGIDWADEITSENFSDWRSWLEEIKNIQGLKVRRQLAPISLQSAKSIDLHVFCDARDLAFACAAYLRIDTGGSVVTPFIMGKVRLGPLKGLTIPRMELNAALIGARLAKSIHKAFGGDLTIGSTTFWTDSSTVLHWIRATDKRFKMYVAARINEIADLSRADQWRYVPTLENVADDATKIKDEPLTSDSRWLLGPGFLERDPEDWPSQKELKPTDVPEEEKAIQIAVKIDPEAYLPDAKDFSCWFRLMRATAARFVAIRRMRRQEPRHITVDDMRRAEKLWIRAHQKKYFSEEIDDLQREGAVERNSRILKLSPGLNSDGLLVLRGRLENAELDERVKRPPILDPNDHYVKLMIKWYHHTGQHFGQERLINELRRSVWILGVRAAVRKCRATCGICQRQVVSPIPPEMGQLPAGRVQNGQKPFYHTGVDFFGPLFVKVKRSREKRWGVIFTCLATRAVHLELADSLSTSAMLNTLIRFISTRGSPGHVWSDNGTNFVGADREIRENIQSWNERQIRDDLQKKGIDWHFGVPSSPHMNGAWERLIRDVKRILKNLLKEQFPGEDTLRTFLAEAMSILNSRPITFNSTDPMDPSCITPNNLLQMECVVGPTIPGDYNEQDLIRETWRKSQKLADEFWKRWSREYLPWLAQRQKWVVRAKPLKVGDIVLEIDDNAPRNEWKKGMVVAVFPSRSGQVRAVDVKIARVDPDDPVKKIKTSILRRPVVKLCPLVID